MKKAFLIFLSALLVFSLAACGSDPKPTPTPSVKPTPAEIEQKLSEAVGKDAYLCDTDIDKEWLQNVYRLDLSQVDEYVAKQNSIGSVNPDTVIILKVKDGYTDKAVKAINEGYAQIVSYIRQYPFGTAKVLNGRLYQSGNYVIYVIAGASYEGDDAEAESKLAVSEYAKIDEVIKSVFGALPENLAVVPEKSSQLSGGAE